MKQTVNVTLFKIEFLPIWPAIYMIGHSFKFKKTSGSTFVIMSHKIKIEVENPMNKFYSKFRTTDESVDVSLEEK